MDQAKIGNRLLDAIPQADRDRLLAGARRVQLAWGDRMFERDHIPQYCFFPLSGLASVVFTSERGATVEQETIGNEGLVGWVFLLGGQPPVSNCLMQCPGDALRVLTSDLQTEFTNSSSFRSCVLELVQHQVTLCNQIEACNRLHRAEARLSRWLLMVQDRMQSDTLPITQEFLSNMLGTRRTTVTEVAGILERSGAIEARRGQVRIVDRLLLRSRACECYGILLSRFQGLYGKSSS